MKDSGVEWIGEIPILWEVKKLGSLYKKRNEKVSDIDYQPLSVTKNGILPQLETAAKSNDHENRKLVLKDDFVINSRADRKMSSGTSSYDGSVSLINHVLYSEIMNPQYTNYLLKNYSFAEEFYRWGSGIVDDLWSTNWDKMKKINIPIPSGEDQINITQELDAKISVISNILTKTRKSIENLKKYKQSLITEVVTKGLDKNVEMKDSGIEWIGEIPKGWEIRKMKNLGRIINGLTFDPSDVTDEQNGILLLRSGNIQNGKLDFQNNIYIKKSAIDEKKIVNEDDILICSRNGSRNLIGKNALITENVYATFGAFMMLFKIDNYNSRYLYYILNSGVFNYYLGTFLTSTINQLTKNNFDNMQIVFTEDILEQRKIVKYLDNKVKLIDELINNKSKIINEYESYKKSLIYEYVTGKKEVREEVE